MQSLGSFRLTATCKLHLYLGDLTAFKGDAIVNAANEQMLGGLGVDGAIHGAAGPGLLHACKTVPAPGGVRCPTGEARVTLGFGLPAKYVIHTVGPVYIDDETSQPLLASAYRSTLELANKPEHGINCIAFPAISCGVYGYPIKRAAHIALQECQLHAGLLSSIAFVLFSNSTATPFVDCANGLLQGDEFELEKKPDHEELTPDSNEERGQCP